MKPFLVTEPQAGRVPFWGLLFLASAYALPGLLGRDPWRGDDAVGFGVAYNMLLALQTGKPEHWLISRIPGQLLPDEGPFPFWIGSIVGHWLQGIGLDFSLTLRLLWALAWLATLVLCWRAVFRLCRRPEWMPHDPLGIAASPRRIAASLADSSVLFLLATVGLVERVHETSPEAFAMLIAAAGFYCLAWALDSPKKAGWAFGAVIAAAFLSKGLWFAFALGLTLLFLVKASPQWQSIANAMLPRLALMLTVSLGLWFWLIYGRVFVNDALNPANLPTIRERWIAGWWQLQFSGPAQGIGQRLFELCREPWWFFWPVWPFAAWGLWHLRQRYREPGLLAPIALIGTTLLLTPIAPGTSLAWLMPMAIPLAALAAISLPTLRPGLVRFVDWYAVLIYGLIAFMFWAYYLAWLLGWPEKMAYRMGILARGDQAAEVWVNSLAALVISGLWIALVVWRLSRRPSVLWKPVLLASSGLVWIWFLFQTLFLEAHNTRNSYREMAAQISQSASLGSDCISPEQVRPAVQASLQWFAGLQFSDQRDCPWLMIQDSGEAIRQAPATRNGWQLVWTGARRGEKQERFRLYRQDPVIGLVDPARD